MRPGVAALLACLLVPASAGAATRYVSPQGAGAGPCTRAAPCSIAWAVNGEGSAAGDEIVVGRGTYVDQPMIVGRPLTVTAAPDAPRPVLRVTTPGAIALSVTEGGADSVVEHLVVRATGDGGVGADLAAAATLQDAVVSSATAACLRSGATGVRLDDVAFTQRGAGTEPCLQATGDDTIWNDVRAIARDGDLAATFSGNGSITDGTFTARLTGLQLGGDATAHRVTASGDERGIALSGAAMVTDSVAVARRGGSAVLADSGQHELLNVTAWASGAGSSGVRAAGGAQLTVKNTIARGRAADLVADPASPTIGGGCASITGCPAGRIVADHSSWRTGPGVEDAGANQAASPRFVDAPRNFRLRPGSPAIDAGSFESNASAADRAGRFRWLGLRPDMGAYEFPSPRTPPRRLDTRHPRLGAVRLSARAFRVGGHGVAFASSHARRTGTTLFYAVSEKSDLVVLVSRPGRGRSRGTIVVAVPRGAGRLRISGRVDGRALTPGRYVLTVLARDVAQNLSRPRHLGFTVVR